MSEGEKAEALKAAVDALKAEGYNVLTQEQMSDRLRQATKEIDPLKTRLEELEAEYKKASKALQAYQDKDKTAEQRIADELKSKQEMIDAWQEKYQRQVEATKAEQQLRKSNFVRETLMDIMSSSVNPRAAAKLALDEVSGLDAELGDNGEFKLTYVGPDRLPGDPKEAVESWYKQQSFLHRAAGDGVPAGQINPPSEQRSKLTDITNPRDRIEKAFFPDM